jgi:predicted ATPase
VPAVAVSRRREAVVAEVVKRLADADTRLSTLTGPGGRGKTRLALLCARQVSEVRRGLD